MRGVRGLDIVEQGGEERNLKRGEVAERRRPEREHGHIVVAEGSRCFGEVTKPRPQSFAVMVSQCGTSGVDHRSHACQESCGERGKTRTVHAPRHSTIVANSRLQSIQ